MNRLAATFLIAFISPLVVSPLVQADGSPWVPEDGSISFSLDITSGSAGDFFIADESTDLGGDIEGTFVWLNANYGYDDVWAFDFRTGYARSSFETNPTEQEDVADTSFGVTYQVFNEFELDNGAPTVALRAGLTLGGDYETNIIEAIGDGADGLDLSLLVGKSITDSIALGGDLTYRTRNDDVSDAIKLLVSAFYTTPLQGLSLQFGAGIIRTDSDVNIGDANFGADLFPQTDRDSDVLIAGLNYGFENGFGLGATVTSVLDGRNVADTDIGTILLSYSF